MKSSQNNLSLAEVGIVFLLFGIISFMYAVNLGDYNNYINPTANGASRFLIEYMGFLGIVVGISLMFLSSAFIKKALKTILKIDTINNLVKRAILLNLLLLVIYAGADGVVWFRMVYQLFVVANLNYNLWINSFFLIIRDTTFFIVYQNVTLIIFVIAIILNTITIFSFQKQKIMKVDAWLKSVVFLNLILPVFYIILDYLSWMNINVKSDHSAFTASSSYNILTIYVYFFRTDHNLGAYDVRVSYFNLSVFIFLLVILLNVVLLIKSQVIQTTHTKN